MATDFARFAISQSNDKTSKPFQKLLFLMRDWTNTEDFDYGYDGGMKYIKTQLEISPHHKNELKSVREFIHSSFDKISCFLMPRPDGFINKKGYDGRWFNMDYDFKKQLMDFVSSLLSPSNLLVKKINNKDLNAKQLNDYMKTYFEIFKSNELLKVETIYEATARTQLLELVSKCIEKYKSIVDMQVLNYSTPYFNVNLENNHQLFKNYTLSFYRSSNKMGSDVQKEEFMEQLNESMEKDYKIWQTRELLKYNNYNAEMERIQKEIDQREVASKNVEVLYNQTSEKFEDALKENAQLMKDLNNANHDIELNKQSLTACDDKLKAADKIFAIRDSSCSKTENNLVLSTKNLRVTQEKFANQDVELKKVKACDDKLIAADNHFVVRNQACTKTEKDLVLSKENLRASQEKIVELSTAYNTLAESIRKQQYIDSQKPMFGISDETIRSSKEIERLYYRLRKLIYGLEY